MLKVMQIRIKVYLLVEIPAEKMQAEIASLIDRSLVQDEYYAEYHERNQYKMYCLGSCYPVEADKIYKQGNIYTVTIRTIDAGLARYFAERTVNSHTGMMKALTSQVSVIAQRPIDILWTLTPAVIKCEGGYWRDFLSVEQYEERLRVNLQKKWNQYYGERQWGEFELFTGLEFLNQHPIAVEYKGIRLLGDKLRLHVAGNEKAQSLAQLAVGTGLAELNARGAGFCNYRWI